MARENDAIRSKLGLEARSIASAAPADDQLPRRIILLGNPFQNWMVAALDTGRDRSADQDLEQK